MAEVESIRDSGLATPIPMHLRYTAREFPIVGTTLDYFEFRGLQIATGHALGQIGQAVLGANVAAELNLGPGDSLFSDQTSLYDITQTYPLKMHIVGVLTKTGTPDDGAVFVDMKTAWIIAGICHGHQDVAQTDDPKLILKRDKENVMTSAAIVEYNEVTPENLASFHMHAQPPELPLSAIIVVPNDDKSATLIKARYGLSETHQMLVPAEVVDELMGLVFRVKKFFDANFALIAVSTLLFIILVVLLSQRIRKREMETMFKIGCSRRMVFWLQAAELGIVILIAAVLASGLSIAALLAAPRFAGLM
jgi:putative ABC transport system permease protein